MGPVSLAPCHNLVGSGTLQMHVLSPAIPEVLMENVGAGAAQECLASGWRLFCDNQGKLGTVILCARRVDSKEPNEALDWSGT